MPWYLKGAAGEPLDDTLREPSSFGVGPFGLAFRSLDHDTLSWTAATENATGAGTIVPRIGQVVELWADSVRRFRGHAVAPNVRMKQIGVTVQGPWWWMSKIPVTSDQTDALGTTSERPAYTFSTGSLKTNIEALIDRAIANGVPIRRGTVAAMFDVPRMTLSETSCASALATLMQWCPDAVAWFDYSDVSGSGLPILNISRRGGMAATTLTIGTDRVEDCDIVPRLDLEVTRTELAYVVRQADTGKPSWAVQASGTVTAGKRQIVTVSGPEISDYLPRDDFASQAIQTAEVKNLVAEMYAFDPAVKSVIDAGYTDGFPGYYNGQAYGVFTGRAPIQCNLSSSGKHRLTSGEVQEWMKESLGRDGGGGLIPGVVLSDYRVSGWAYFLYDTSYGNTVEQLRLIGRAVYGVFGANKVYAVQLDYTIPVINVSFPTLTTVYRAWDYDYLTPPAGLAAALVGCQNWVPWEGPITLVGDDVTGENLLAGKFHLAGSLPECASMGALAREVNFDLKRSRTTINLGAPARTDFGSLVSRIRRDPKDNIVALT